jgi:hypothetical protein
LVQLTLFSRQLVSGIRVTWHSFYPSDGAEGFFRTAYLPDDQIKIEVVGLALDDAGLDALIVSENNHSHAFQQTAEGG